MIKKFEIWKEAFMKGWRGPHLHTAAMVDACTLRNLLLTAIPHHFNWSPAIFRKGLKEIRFENVRKERLH